MMCPNSAFAFEEVLKYSNKTLRVLESDGNQSRSYDFHRISKIMDDNAIGYWKIEEERLLREKKKAEVEQLRKELESSKKL